MRADEFQATLLRATKGDNEALADIIEMYMPLINSRSYVDGQLDEDIRQYILLHILKKYFKIFPLRGKINEISVVFL